MKKNSLAMIASLICFPLLANETPSIKMNSPVSNLEGIRVTVGGAGVYHMRAGSFEFSDPAFIFSGPNKKGSTLSDGSIALGDTYLSCPLDNQMEFYLSAGYAKVLGWKIVLGASVFGGYNPYTVDVSKSQFTLLGSTGTASGGTPLNGTDGKPLDANLPADKNFTFGSNWLGGAKVDVGFLVTSDIAIKLIGDVKYSRYTKTANNTSTSAGVTGFSIGMGVDFALTNHIILGIGAKQRLYRTSMVMDDNFEIKYGGLGLEAFAELSYRIGQD